MSESSGQAPKLPKTQKARLDKRRNARKYAVQALYQWHMNTDTAFEIEAQFRVNNDMKDTDVALFSELIKGVISSTPALDETFTLLLDRKLSELDPVELAVMRIGAFELQERPQVPYRVVINECVELTKIFGATDSHRYVNGILDKLAQQLRPVEVRMKKEGR